MSNTETLLIAPAVGSRVRMPLSQALIDGLPGEENQRMRRRIAALMRAGQKTVWVRVARGRYNTQGTATVAGRRVTLLGPRSQLNVVCERVSGERGSFSMDATDFQLARL